MLVSTFAATGFALASLAWITSAAVAYSLLFVVTVIGVAYVNLVRRPAAEAR